MAIVNNVAINIGTQMLFAKGHMFLIICGIYSQYKYKQYYEKH
jgi:hypothetical protein